MEEEEREEKEIEPSLEFMAKDGAWYAGTVSMTGPSMKNMRVHFLHYDEDEDEIWYPHSFRSCDDVNAMIRLVSEPMEDSDCGKLRPGMILCVACRRPDSECFEYYDARLEQLDRSKHRGQDICRCRFEVEWLGGPLRRQRQFVPCGDICLLKPGDIEDDPVVKEFIKHVKDAVQTSRKRLCVTKSTSAKDQTSSSSFNCVQSLPALVDPSKPLHMSEPNQNMAQEARVGEEEKCSKFGEEHNGIINLDSDDELGKEDIIPPIHQTMEPQEGAMKHIIGDHSILEKVVHDQDLNDMESDTTEKPKSLTPNNVKQECAVKMEKSDSITRASNAPKAENIDRKLPNQSVPQERSPMSVDNCAFHIVDDALPDRLAEVNTCVQNGPSILPKENMKLLNISQVLLVENLEMDLTPSMALEILLEVSPGALMVYIWPYLEYEITKKAYVFYKDSEGAEIAFSSFHSDKFMVISSKGRPWVVSRADICLSDWNLLCNVGGAMVATKEVEANNKGNQSTKSANLSILHRGAEKYASAVARYKLFLAQKKKISTYIQMFQEEERMLEEALAS